MNGTDKQKAWAINIRNTVIPFINTNVIPNFDKQISDCRSLVEIMPEAADLIEDLISKKTNALEMLNNESAKFWIDNFSTEHKNIMKLSESDQNNVNVQMFMDGITNRIFTFLNT